MHSQGVIHRDLKPSNIFINRTGDVEIGDFGLATSGRVVSKAEETAISNLSISTSLTSGVGTPFYLAPEQEKAGQHYDIRVDIYSLGIIFFEMCFSFRTAAERRDVLVRLRSVSTSQLFSHLFFTSAPKPELPPAFVKSNPKKASLILWLLRDDPKQRPSTSEILNSEFLPPKMEEEILKEAIRSIIAQANSSIFDHLVQKLFSLPVEPRQDVAFGPLHSLLPFLTDSGATALTSSELHVRDGVRRRLIHVFERHGALPVEINQTLPAVRLVHYSSS